jgi:hypothetical protein
MRALKLAGLVACSLALSVAGAAAAPQVLDEAALDNVVAGAPGDFSQSFGPGSGFPQRPPLGFPSFFPTPEPAPVPTIEIPLEADADSQSSSAVNGGALASTSITTGEAAEQARQNPGQFFPIRPIFPSFPGFR